MSWQPIETYPKDGTLVLLLFTNGADEPYPTEDNVCWRTIGQNNDKNDGEDTWCVCGWDWCNDQFMALRIHEFRGTPPTHWCPLPELPE